MSTHLSLLQSCWFVGVDHDWPSFQVFLQIHEPTYIKGEGGVHDQLITICINKLSPYPIPPHSAGLWIVFMPNNGSLLFIILLGLWYHRSTLFCTTTMRLGYCRSVLRLLFLFFVVQLCKPFKFLQVIGSRSGRFWLVSRVMALMLLFRMTMTLPFRVVILMFSFLVAVVMFPHSENRRWRNKEQRWMLLLLLCYHHHPTSPCTHPPLPLIFSFSFISIHKWVQYIFLQSCIYYMCHISFYNTMYQVCPHTMRSDSGRTKV